MRVCTTCRRYGVRSNDDNCPTCGTLLLSAPYRWSPPKHKDKRAWRRIKNGEWLWDRRRVVRSKRNRVTTSDTLRRFKTRKIEIEHECSDEYCQWHHQANGLVRIERVPGSEYEVVNQNRLPDVDMGG